MSSKPEPKMEPLPAPWDRIFRLGTRVFVWGSIAAIIYILRPFFLLIFLTFVFAYIQSHAVDGLGRWIPHRIARVVVVFLVFLGILMGVGSFVLPHIQEQAINFGKDYQAKLQEVDDTIVTLAEKHGFADKIPQDFSTERILSDVVGLGGPGGGGDEPLKKTAAFLIDAGTILVAVSSAFLLSLLFSFLIVLDLPNLTRKTKAIAHTKIGWIYDEVADSVYNFCKVLGRALEAQFFIALVNTVLTSIGLWLLGIPQIVVLATIVFLCSFIPVAGVFISSTPICLVALQISGLQLMMLCVAMILIVHFVEAYFLNPMIYGHHMRMNPVLVLIILTVGGKLFGVWGLVLGIPVMNYVFGHAIRPGKPPSELPAEETRPAKSA